MANRQERQEARGQLGEAMILGGVLALFGTPVVYRIRSASAHAGPAWWWPTWWMLVPLVVAVLGALLIALPASFDLRRALLHSRFVTRRRGS